LFIIILTEVYMKTKNSWSYSLFCEGQLYTFVWVLSLLV